MVCTESAVVEHVRSILQLTRRDPERQRKLCAASAAAAAVRPDLHAGRQEQSAQCGFSSPRRSSEHLGIGFYRGGHLVRVVAVKLWHRCSPNGHGPRL